MNTLFVIAAELCRINETDTKTNGQRQTTSKKIYMLMGGDVKKAVPCVYFLIIYRFISFNCLIQYSFFLNSSSISSLLCPDPTSLY